MTLPAVCTSDTQHSGHLYLLVGSCVTPSGLPSTSCSNGTFSRKCNTGPCAPTAWRVGAWGACSKTCADKHGPGTQTRTVGCYQYTDGSSSVVVMLLVLDMHPVIMMLTVLCMGAQHADVVPKASVMTAVNSAWTCMPTASFEQCCTTAPRLLYQLHVSQPML